MKMKQYPKKFFLTFIMHLAIGSGLLAQVPVINSFLPGNGSPGKSITLTGSNFNSTIANNIVFFGATKATVTAASATQLVVTVPIGATSKPITVLNSGSGLSAASKMPFTVTVAPYTGQDFAAGSFTAAVAYNQSILFRGVAVADFDGDGKADIVGYSNTPSPVVVSVLRNTSTRSAVSFAARQDFSLPVNATGRLLATGDVDNDGKIDIIIGSANTTVKGLYVFRNTSIGSGNISFTRVDFSADNNLNNFAVGDLDGDGKPEIVASNTSGSMVSVYKNTSTPGNVLLAKTNFAANASGSGIAIGDVDGDGKPEILVADQGGPYLSVFRNTVTNGTIDATSFATKVDFDLGTSGFHYTVSLGDLDGDGKLDIVVSQGSGTSVSVFRNTGTAGTISASSLAARFDLPLSASSFASEIADMDGDGKLDIVATAGSKIAVFRNKINGGSLTSGSFANGVEYAADAGSLSSPNAMAIADINSDGKPDLVPSLPSSTYTFSVMTGTTGYALPLHWVSIKAYQKAAGNQVNWTITSEEAVVRYEVERSANGQRFATLGSIAAKGSSNGLQTYGFTDAAPLNGLSYYRIQTISKTGETTYSSVVKISTEKQAVEITAYPNPVNGNEVALQLNAMAQGNYLLTVYNPAGQPVLRKVIGHTGGSAVETIVLPAHLAKGIYQLTLSGKDNTAARKLVKE